jgi:hypothetical protein
VQRHFRTLDVALTLAGPEEVIGPIVAAYARFVRPEQGSLTVTWSENGLHLGGRNHPPIAGVEPTLQVYHRLLGLLLRRIGSHAMLHAAALTSPDIGDAFLLAGSSGHGKTSLSLELARRGCGFLGDDLAPLDLERREIHPYPRAVGIRPHGGATIPAAFREAALVPSVPSLFGKSLVDVGRVLGESALHPGPAPLRRVIVLGGRAAGPPAVTGVQVGCRAHDASAVGDRLAAISGVEVLGREARADLVQWTLRVDHAGFPTEALSRLLAEDAVVFSEKFWGDGPDFEAVPRATPIRRRVAAETLARELLNRAPDGALLRRYRGDLPGLFLDLAGALRDAQCWRVEVGRFEETADVVEGLLRSPVQCSWSRLQ